MLPFLKNKDDGAMSGPVESVERKHDDGFDIVDAIAEDVLMAVEKKDKAMLKGALQSLCEYLKDMDEQQDKEMVK